MKTIALAAAALLCASAASAQQSAFIAEIIPMAGKVCPQGWLVANGAILPVQQNQPLFSLIRNTYGGNGTTNFALPNLTGGTIGPAAQSMTWCIASSGMYPLPNH